MKTDRYTIYVGLNDCDSKVQKFDTEKFKRIIEHICQSYDMSYSISPLSGGYFHDNGQFVKEDSFQIVLIGGSTDIANSIAEDACAFFNQESVLVIHDVVDSYLIRNSLRDRT